MVIFHDLDIAKSLRPHDAQDTVRLADANLEIQSSAGPKGLFPLL